MKLDKIKVKNFRLLRDVTLCLEDRTTVIVGRNNSGKTSLTELFRRFLDVAAPRFSLEDFSMSVHGKFWNAYLGYRVDNCVINIRELLPVIEAELLITYDEDSDLGYLSEFVIDLDPSSTQAIAVIRYQLQDGGIDALFNDLPIGDDPSPDKVEFYKTIQKRISQLYKVTVLAIDPMDRENQKEVQLSALRGLLQASFIHAHRGLDDTTHREKDTLGKILEKLLSTASEETAVARDREIAKELDGVIYDIQNTIDDEFNKRLHRILPALNQFGYPGLNDSEFQTVTTLDVKRLLENHTKILYAGESGVALPETYNGLGSRNLMYILFQLFEFFRSYQAKKTAPSLHLIFIEEPEAHLHPQMQEVFVRQLEHIAKIFSEEFTWPVQFVVTTHSTHMANAAPFEAIRYFLSKKVGNKHTVIRDLRKGFGKDSEKEDKEFLNKYLTLTRCDLFFADKAILIEGPSERLLIPKMIEKVDQEYIETNLGSQYLSVVEVGGAYAHRFYKLLDFLELRTIVVSDLDSIDGESRKKCKVADASRISNACIKDWFGKKNIEPSELIAKTDKEKISNYRRIVYQIPELETSACGRSFEDAFILANQDMFGINGLTDEDIAAEAWDEAQKLDKTNFALEHAIEKTDWNVPRYIKEGLLWLAKSSDQNSNAGSELTPVLVEEGTK